MNHKKLIDDCLAAKLPNRQIARQLYFLTPSYAFDGNQNLQLRLYEEICDYLRLPLSAIRLVGSGHTGFSLVKSTAFNPKTSDLDIAVVDSNLYLDLFEIAFETTGGWRDITKFSGRGDRQRQMREEFLRYLRKGVIRPDLMPSSPRKADWENFFGKLGDEYAQLCNGISAGDEGALPWPAEEHRSTADTVRAVESVDGAQAVDGNAGGSPSEDSVRAWNGAPRLTQTRTEP